MNFRFFRDVSIHSKVVILVMAISLAALALTFAIFTFVGIEDERQRSFEEARGLADFIGINVRAALLFGDERFAGENLEALSTRGDISAAYVLDPEMALFAWYLPDNSGSFGDRITAQARLAQLMNHHCQELKMHGLLYEQEMVHLLRPVRLDEETLGYVYLQTNLSQMKRAIAKRFKAAAGALTLSLVFAYLLARRLHTLISRPLDDLAAAMEQVSTSEAYDMRLEEQRQDEFGKLIAGFNHMLDQIEARDGRLEEANRELEKRVDSRTLELRRANEELRWQVEERIRMEQALQESETKYRLLFENSPISLWEEDCTDVLNYLTRLRGEGVTDFRSYFDSHPEEVRACAGMVRVLDVNQRTVENFKAADKTELLAELEHVFSENSYPAFREMLIAMVEGNRQFEIEGVNRTLDGEERMFSIRFSMFPEEEYGKTVLSLVDITDSKKAEAALLESEERFRTLVEQAADGFIVHDIRGKILDVNSRMCSMMGYSREELLRKTIRDLDEDYDADLYESMWTGMSPGDTFTTESLGYRKDGSAIEVEGNIGVLESLGERKIVALIRDVTQRKEMERELVCAKSRLEHLLTSTPAGIYTARATGEGVTFVSDNVRTMLGYEPRQFMEDPAFWSERLHPEDRERILTEVPSGIARGEHVHEYRFRHSDGSYRWMLDEFRLVRDPGGSPLEIVGYWIDITVRKEAEEKLKVSLAEKEVLLQEVNHRVKNNLQIISSLLSLQLTKVAGKETRGELLVARNRIHSMAHIHESLYRSADLSQVNFSDHVRQFAARLTSLYDAKHITMIFDLEDIRLDVNAAIPCSMIINELMTNALKYAFPDGRAGNITLRMGTEGGWHLLSVEDDGVGPPQGIDMDKLSSLGLHLVTSLAGQLNGSMTVERERGMRVSIRFSAG